MKTKIKIAFFMIVISTSFANTILLGIALPLNGKDEFVGLSQKNAILLAHSLYPSYKDYNIKLKIVDISCNTKEQTLTLLASNVIAVIGYPRSSRAVRVVDVFESNEVPLILPTATNSILTSGRQFIYMMMPSDMDEAEDICDFINKRLDKFRDRKIAFVYDRNDLYCNGVISKVYYDLKKSAFEAQYKNFAFDESQSSMQILFNKLVRYSPNLSIVALSPYQTTSLLRMLKREHSDLPVLFTSSVDTQLVYESLHSFNSKNNIYISTVEFNDEDDYFKIDELYKSKFGQSLDLYSFMAYTSYLSFYNALKSLIDNDEPVLPINLNKFFDGEESKMYIKRGGGGVSIYPNKLLSIKYLIDSMNKTFLQTEEK